MGICHEITTFCQLDIVPCYNEVPDVVDNSTNASKVFLTILHYKTKELFALLSQPPALKLHLVNNELRPIICSWQESNNFLRVI